MTAAAPEVLLRRSQVPQTKGTHIGVGRRRAGSFVLGRQRCSNRSALVIHCAGSSAFLARQTPPYA